MRSEFTRGTALLATLAGIPSSVATLTVTTVTSVTTTATTKRPPLALALAHHAAGRSVGSLLLDVGSGDNLGGEVEPLAEVVKTLETEEALDSGPSCLRDNAITYLGGEGVVVVLPRELGLDETAGGQGLHSLDDLLRKER